MSHSLFRILLLASLLGSAPCLRADEVDDFIKAQMRARQIPGLSLAVVKAGKTIKAQGFGFANLELNVPVTTETVFEIGSLTKQFTATAIMMLVEEGKLSLDDKITRHLEGLPEAWNGITVQHLLTHTSGIKNYTGLSGFEVTRKLKAAQFIQTMAQHPLGFQPGESYSYCNTGYSLLGYIIEKLSGKTYWQFLSERIFNPLGMTSCQSRELRTIIPQRADGYELESGKLINRDSDLTDVFSAGAIVSTVLDLVKWNAALDAGRLLKRSSFQQMWTPVALNSGKPYPYGFGWRVDEQRGHKNIGHSGSTSGFSASLQRFPDDKLTVIVLCNSGEQNVATTLARSIADLYFSKRSQ